MAKFNDLRLKENIFGLTLEEKDELNLYYERLGDPDEVAEYDDYSQCHPWNQKD